MSAPEFFTLAEVCRSLRTNDKTLRGYIKSGALEAVKYGREWRVTETALAEFVASMQTNRTDLAETA